MEQAHLIGAFEHDSDPTLERVLEQQNSYIVARVAHHAYGNSTVGPSGNRGLDLDDLTQQVRIKLWMALRRRHIEHHRAYIRAIVQNEFNDIPRKPKQPLPLLTDDDGELFMGDLVITEGSRAVNPEEAFIELEGFREMLDFLISCIAEMPPRQRRVLACSVYESFGERLDVIETFRRYSLDCNVYLWPEDEDDKKLLQASHAVARRNLAKKIQSKSAQCQQGRVPEKIKARASSF